MEKLIELLNKHRIELAHGNLQNQLMRHYNGYVFGLGDLNSQNCVLLIISKEYGFIKWLVENDKIDTDKLKKIGYEKTIYMYDGQYREIVEYSASEAILMLLSISSSPIDDLISYLR